MLFAQPSVHLPAAPHSASAQRSFSAGCTAVQRRSGAPVQGAQATREWRVQLWMTIPHNSQVCRAGLLGVQRLLDGFDLPFRVPVGLVVVVGRVDVDLVAWRTQNEL